MFHKILHADGNLLFRKKAKRWQFRHLFYSLASHPMPNGALKSDIDFLCLICYNITSRIISENEKKSMKKFIISTIATIFTVLAVGSVAHAAAAFNVSAPMPTMTVTNATTHPCTGGVIDGCWQTSTTARPGDVIAVHVYYENTGYDSGSNTKIRISPSRNGTAVRFSGGVSSSDGGSATGTASVTLSTATIITYMDGSDGACWYPSSASGCHAVNAGQLFGSGFDIGTIAPGDQGVLVARFYVDGASGSTNNDNDCRIDSFDADDSSIDEGDNTRLRWTTTNCDYVNIESSEEDFSNLNPDSSVTVSPDNTVTYTLKAYDDDGNLDDTDTVRVSVDDNNNDSCSIDDFYASPTSINRNSSSTLHWKTSGVDYVTISGLSGSRSADSSLSVSPYDTTTYKLTARCDNGDTETDTLTVSVKNTETSTRPQAITTVANVLSGSQARLNGLAVPNTTSGTTTAWFEWGTSGSLGARTSSQVVGSGFASSYYSDVVSGLVPGGVYYYRAAVQNQNGTAYGDIVRFQTNQNTVIVTTPPRTIVQPTRVTTNVVTAESAPSLLELRVESAYDRMCIGGNMDYTITYRNISSQTLENTVLRFTHPKEITYISASRGDYEVVDRTVTIDLGSVRPGEQGTVTIHTRVNEFAVRDNLTVATATVVYTNTVTRAQEDATAYSLITVSDDCPNVLGASVVGFGSFLPDTLLEWLLLILIILALVVLGRNVYKKKDEKQVV